MQKITPFLWFDNQAEEAGQLYTSIFPNSRILETLRYGEAGPGPAGSVMTVSFELAGQQFTGLNGGPEYKFTPAVSFFVNCQTPEEIHELWDKLGQGGKVLMELDRYPFSPQFGWLEDRYGLSWQLNLSGRGKKIVPFLTYVGDRDGSVEKAIKQYTSLFPNSAVRSIARHGKEPRAYEGTVSNAVFALDGEDFMAMDAAREHHSFTFNPALSFVVNCETQEEVDKFWDGLSEGGEPGVCGWLQDRYGVSWQVVPVILLKFLGDKDPEKANRVMKAMLQMKKLDIAAIQAAYEGR